MKCEVCGTTYTESTAPHSQAVYCSATCRDKDLGLGGDPVREFREALYKAMNAVIEEQGPAKVTEAGMNALLTAALPTLPQEMQGRYYAVYVQPATQSDRDARRTPAIEIRELRQYIDISVLVETGGDTDEPCTCPKEEK